MRPQGRRHRVGGPRAALVFGAAGGRRTQTAVVCSRLEGVHRLTVAPPAPPPVQWEHPNSPEQKPCQMESDVQKLGHRSNTMDSRRSWTTRKWVMQPDVPRPFSSQT